MNDSGKSGEDFAARTLAGLGYDVIKRNYHSLYGEIDIIALNGGFICFIEVKARKKGSIVSGVQSVTPSKQKKIILTAAVYLQESDCMFQPRFDVFCIETGSGGMIYSYDHLIGAFDGDGYDETF